MRQRTVINSVEIDGVGLHSGLNTKIVLNPSKTDTGIIFRLFDIDDDNSIVDSFILKALFNNVIDTKLGTTISNNIITVSTIEHLMASLWACDIGNIVIDVFTKKQEIPILDGSSILFIDKIKQTGINELHIKRKYIKILKEVEIKLNDSYIKIEPCDNFCIDMTVDYDYGNIGKQHYYFDGNKNEFIDEISQARTFCNEKEIEFMKKHDLAKGGSLENAMVFNDTNILNPEGFRCDNEVVKHKIIDCIGDMFTAGYFMIGKITAYKTGHTLNNMLLKKIFQDKENYKMIE